MEIIKFQDAKEELLSNFKRKMLIPVIGSGFTRGCKSYNGCVPSGKDYRKYMIKQINESNLLSESEKDNIKGSSFSNVADTYHDIVDLSTKKKYISDNFTKDLRQAQYFPYGQVYSASF